MLNEVLWRVTCHLSPYPLIIKWMPKVVIGILGNNYTKSELNLNNTQKTQLSSSMQYAGDGYEQQLLPGKHWW